MKLDAFIITLLSLILIMALLSAWLIFPESFWDSLSWPASDYQEPTLIERTTP